MRRPEWTLASVSALGAAALVAAFSCSPAFEGDDESSGGAAAAGGEEQGGSGNNGGKGGASVGGAATGTGGTMGEAGAGAEPSGGSSTGGSSSGGSSTGGSSPGGTGNGGTTPEGGAGTGPGTPTYRDVVLADHPLVYWRMGIATGRSVPDEAGGENSLVLQGAGHVLGAEGAIRDDDTAIGFDGVASYAIATDARVLDFTERAPFTIECWARRVSGSPSYFQHLVSNIVGSAGSRDGYVLYLLPEPEANTIARSSFEYDRRGAEVALTGPMPEELAWAYYAAVFDGSTAKFYVNGNLESTQPIDGNFAARTGPFAVGRDGSTDGHYFKGDLDELAVYARALGIADIVEHYDYLRR